MRTVPSIILIAAALGVGAAVAAAPRSPASSPRSSPASREYASTARTLAGLTPGAPVACISLSRSRSSSFLDRDTIAYHDTARRYYVNRTSGGCDFDEDSIVVTRTPSDQLCRGDIITLIDRTSRFPRGSCAFGDFVPYAR